MISIFTLPKAFTGDIGILQENAIRSWKEECPNSEIILAGDEPNLQEITSKFNLTFLPGIEKNKFGSYYLDDLFRKARNIARFNNLVFLNTDCILMGDLEKIMNLASSKFEKFLLVGARYDSEISEPLPETNWREFVLNHRGLLHPDARRRIGISSIGGLDIFGFSKNTFEHIPSFVVGVAYWDGWLPYDVKNRQIPMIEISDYISVVHQKHPPRTERSNYKQELQWNRSLSSGQKSSRDADFIIDENGQIVKDKRFSFLSFSENFIPEPVNNWRSVAPNSEILLSGGLNSFEKINQNIPRLFCFPNNPSKNKFGTVCLIPFLKGMRSVSRFSTFCCLQRNCFLFGDLEKLILQTKEKFQDFIIIGKTWRILDNSQPNIEILSEIKQHAKILPPEAIHYRIFTLGALSLESSIPDFHWDRLHWDVWFLQKAHERNIPIIDASRFITSIIIPIERELSSRSYSFSFDLEEQWNYLNAFSQLPPERIEKNFGRFVSVFHSGCLKTFKTNFLVKPFSFTVDNADYLYFNGEIVRK